MFALCRRRQQKQRQQHHFNWNLSLFLRVIYRVSLLLISNAFAWNSRAIPLHLSLSLSSLFDRRSCCVFFVCVSFNVQFILSIKQTKDIDRRNGTVTAAHSWRSSTLLLLLLLLLLYWIRVMNFFVLPLLLLVCWNLFELRARTFHWLDFNFNLMIYFFLFLEFTIFKLLKQPLSFLVYQSAPIWKTHFRISDWYLV